ncbi:peptidoglycan-binding domain-containing protein [Kitasatospora purpeofusca]|uniref:Peptidoglycan-binding protein n=1 Tax=Kitasatospora purpeofusca TaxID=67352 RepID=A0ABZ1TV95_9ACTN|nr:peptidoglycan-binding domain-containing protein [Kitasatospora purpeofusca]
MMIKGARTIATIALTAAAVGMLGGTAQARPGASYVRYGSQGDAVKCVQLAVKLYETGTAGQMVTIDGIFGPNTKVGVEEFQFHHLINADGVVGPETGTRMWNVISSQVGGFDFCYNLLPTLH